MSRPSRGERLSAATTRYVGCLVFPIRIRRSFTATSSSPTLLLFLVLLLHHATGEAHGLHHLLHLAELLEQQVDFGGARSAAVGDPQATGSVDDARASALARRHRPDDGFDPSQLTIVDVGVLELLGDPGQHTDDAL